MVRSAVKLVLLSGLLVAGSVCLYVLERRGGVSAQLDAERQRNVELRAIAERLKTETRVADMIVTDQREVNGKVQTTLLFVEYARDGVTPLPARRFTIEGKEAHVDALVVKFDGRYVEQNDVLRGRSIALFTRIFGNKQSPESAARIDEPGRIPAVYRGADPAQMQFEEPLWRDFWKLADDEAYRREMGVRVMQGESVFRPFEPGRLYTLTIESNGGLNIQSEPLKGVYREALSLQKSQ